MCSRLSRVGAECEVVSDCEVRKLGINHEAFGLIRCIDTVSSKLVFIVAETLTFDLL